MRCVPIIPFGAFRLPRVVGLADDELGPRPVAGIGPVIGRMRLPTDPIGVFTLTLTNIVIGSRIHIETQGDGTTLHDSVADATDETISLSAYAAGSPYNALRIKVRKGTGSPTYKPFETLATAIVGAQSIYVGQIPDE